MATKLTLSADAKVVRLAKRLAAEQGTSLSAMFDRLIHAIDASDATRPELGRLTREAMNITGGRVRQSGRQLLEEALCEKYGVNQ